MAFVILNTKRHFWVADLNARGELHSKADYTYEDLEHLPRAADMIAGFSAALWKSPEVVDLEPILPGTRISCRWRACSPTAGVLTFRCSGHVASLSLLASGKDTEADRITLAVFQRHLLQELHDTGYEPAFDLVALTERPLVATFNLFSPSEPADQMAIAIADRCFAASYFRYQQLA
jgi:hypothetical protein